MANAVPPSGAVGEIADERCRLLPHPPRAPGGLLRERRFWAEAFAQPVAFDPAVLSLVVTPANWSNHSPVGVTAAPAGMTIIAIALKLGSARSRHRRQWCRLVWPPGLLERRLRPAARASTPPARLLRQLDGRDFDGLDGRGHLSAVDEVAGHNVAEETAVGDAVPGRAVVAGNGTFDDVGRRPGRYGREDRRPKLGVSAQQHRLGAAVGDEADRARVEPALGLDRSWPAESAIRSSARSATTAMMRSRERLVAGTTSSDPPSEVKTMPLSRPISALRPRTSRRACFARPRSGASPWRRIRDSRFPDDPRPPSCRCGLVRSLFRRGQGATSIQWRGLVDGSVKHAAATRPSRGPRWCDRLTVAEERRFANPDEEMEARVRATMRVAEVNRRPKERMETGEPRMFQARVQGVSTPVTARVLHRRVS